MRLSLRRLYLSLIGLLPLVLTGCTMSSSAPATPEQGVAIQGRVMGGQVPLLGSQVYLFQAGSGVFTPNASGYGNASISLLTSTGSNTAQSTSGATNGDYYVTSSGVTGPCPSGGCFTITGDYTCTGGAQVYLYSLGGGAGTASYSNSAAGLLAALGTCPGAAGSTGNTFSSGLFITINEVSTVATAYAFAGFATDALDVSSSGTALAQTGIANAFANVTNIETLGTGVALATTPVGSGTVPQAEINTLADILASCVNTTGPSSSACTNLLTNAQTNGSTGGTPNDTATAAINLAHNPGLTAGPLYSYFSSILPTSPFQPTLGSAPNDFTIALNFTAGGIATPTAIAIDGSGDAWIANNGSTASVTELSPLGVALNSSPLTGNGLTAPHGIAIDLNGNAWVANYAVSGSISEFNGSTGAVVGTSPFTGGGLNEPIAIAVDGSDNIWIANYGESTSGSVSKFTNAGVAVSPGGFPGGYGTGMEINTGIAIDPGGNVWTTDLNGVLDKVNNSGTLISGFGGYDGGSQITNPFGLAFDSSSHVWVATHSNYLRVLTDGSDGPPSVAPTEVGQYTGGGLGASDAIAIDGAGNAWIENSKTSLTTPGLLSEFSQSGQVQSPNTGYTSSTLISNTTPIGIAVDGSGDVWVTNNGNASVTEFIGAGVPVVTPLAEGVKLNELGTRP